MAKPQPKFESVLDRPSSEIERPKPLPVGEYVCAIQGQPRFDKSTKKGTEFVEFTLKILEAMETVDEEALDTYLTNHDDSKKKLSECSTKATYYLTENSLWRLKDFLDHCEAGDEDMSLRQRIAETPGKQVTITIKHEAFQDGTGVSAKVGATAPVA